MVGRLMSNEMESMWKKAVDRDVIIGMPINTVFIFIGL
jgi:hypothetical protein